MGKMLDAMLAAVVFLLGAVVFGEAAVYVYVDEAGTAHFTDAPTKSYYRPLPAFGLPRGVNLVRGQYADLINHVALDEGVDPELVRAIIRAESNFDPHAVSRKGAQGLMQLMPATAGRYAVGNAFDPEANIRGGVRYLRSLHDMFPGRLSLALAAYNAGENVVLRHNGIPPYPETQQYVNRVLDYYTRQDPSSGRMRTKEVQAVPSTQKVFRRVDANGTPVYTNLPPLVQSPLGPTR